MNNKILGIVLIIVGVVGIMWGYDIYDSASAQVTRALDGETPMEAWGGMVGGAIAVLVGITRIIK